MDYDKKTFAARMHLAQIFLTYVRENGLREKLGSQIGGYSPMPYIPAVFDTKTEYIREAAQRRLDEEPIEFAGAVIPIGDMYEDNWIQKRCCDSSDTLVSRGETALH